MKSHSTPKENLAPKLRTIQPRAEAKVVVIETQPTEEIEFKEVKIKPVEINFAQFRSLKPASVKSQHVL